MKESTIFVDEMQMRNIHSLSWDECNHLTGSLVEQIRADGCPQIIVGLQRGGLIPAVILSHQLEVQDFLTLPVRRTTSDAVYASKQFPLVLLNDLFGQIIGKDVLVVDDVVGSGTTLREVLRMVCRYNPSRIRSAVLILNQEHWMPVNEQKPTEVMTYIGRELSGWVVFPWEKAPITQWNRTW